MVLFSCGCGEKTTDRKEAVQHVVLKGHTMTASGVIRPEEVGVEPREPRKWGTRTWLKEEQQT